MARGEAAASNASTRERHFPAMGRGTRDGPVGSAELSRRALLQPAAVAWAGGDSHRHRSSGRCAEFAGHMSSCSRFEPNYDPDGGLSDSDSLEDSSASTDDENVSRQKRLLEDALFGFFKKEVVERLSDVKITSPTSFGVRQSQLAKNADALYNNMLAPVVNRQHQTATSDEDITYMPMKTTEHIIIDEIEKELDNNYDAKDDLIIVKEKKLLTLPFEQNTRFPVSEEERKNYNTIIELAYTKGVQKNYALMFPRVHCNYISLGQCLMPTGHMDNFLLPCICRKFFEDCHPTVSGRHHFFPHIGENILNYRSSKQLKTIALSFVGEASSRGNARIIACHWIVFAVDFHYKLFAFLDSHYGKDSNFHMSIREKMIDNFINLWEIIFQTKEHNFRTFKRMYPHVPKQGNELFMELWEPAMDLRKCFSQADITHIRIQYMNQLYFWSKNSTDKRVVTDFNLESFVSDFVFLFFFGRVILSKTMDNRNC
ncbi:hypothetical protein ZWY2020_014309 [Hordeum vulgare]|nr:hypothetical protein ZWY2020_014309 [Hordeum vulgare]